MLGLTSMAALVEVDVADSVELVFDDPAALDPGCEVARDAWPMPSEYQTVEEDRDRFPAMDF